MQIFRYLNEWRNCAKKKKATTTTKYISQKSHPLHSLGIIMFKKYDPIKKGNRWIADYDYFFSTKQIESKFVIMQSKEKTKTENEYFNKTKNKIRWKEGIN